MQVKSLGKIYLVILTNFIFINESRRFIETIQSIIDNYSSFVLSLIIGTTIQYSIYSNIVQGKMPKLKRILDKHKSHLNIDIIDSGLCFIPSS